MTNTTILGLATLSFATMFGGCAATTAMAPSSLDLQARARPTGSDRALVYLYRSESFGGAVKMPVFVDGVYSGDMVPHAYVTWDLAPGRHVIVSKAENNEELELNVERGSAYYVWQEVKMGVMMARSRLHLVSKEEGRRQLVDCKLVAMPPDARAFNASRPFAGANLGPTALQQ